MKKEVIVETITLSKYNCLTRPEFEDWYKSILRAISDAENNGFVNVKLRFNSTLEPYEDNYPGDPELIIYGDRPYTEQELKEQRHQAEIDALAKKLGITFYEASTVHNLQSRGKLKDL